MAIAHHVTFRLWSSRVLASTPGLRLAAMRSLLRVAAPFEVVAGAIVDTHGHLLMVEDREASGELARRVEIGLQRVLMPGEPFERARVWPVADQRHLARTFWYVLKQHEHHGVAGDPWHDASTLPDLLGLRVLGPQLGGRVRRVLPRVGRSELLQLLEWSGERPEEVEWRLLPQAAAAAVGLPGLGGISAASNAGRLAAVHLARRELSQAASAELLGLSRRSVRRLEALVPDQALLRATSAQLCWRSERRQVVLAEGLGGVVASRAGAQSR